MKKEKAIIFVPVGTSLLTNFGETEVPEDDFEDAFKVYIDDKYEPPMLYKRGDFENNRDNDDKPAEISSLYGFCVNNTVDNKEYVKFYKHVEVFLLHTPDEQGEFCSDGIKLIIEKYKPFTDSKYGKWTVEKEPLDGLDPAEADSFYKAFEKMAGFIAETIKNNPDKDIYVNITGGYKPLGSYITMMAMALGGRIKVFYLNDKSPKIHYLPSYPLAFDMLEWRDWRGMLLPFTHDGVLTSGQKRNLFEALENTKVGNFLMSDQGKGETAESAKLNSVGTIISRLYEKQDDAVSEFGSGGLLLGKFKNSKYADYLRKFCIPRWRHLAVGDHIPETVEHGRGHIQRLLELAQQLLAALSLDKKFTDEQLFVLISSIWLHDLGHSGNEFTFRGEKGLFTDKDKPESTELFFIYDEPKKVRKYHNFLSYELIDEERKFLFPLPDTGEPAGIDNNKLNELINSTAVAALYHRRAMPVEKIAPGSEEEVDICRINRGIKDFVNPKIIENFSLIEDLPLVAALLRFLDGAENQCERSGSKESFAVTEWVSKRQVKSMKKMKKTKQDKYEARKKTTLYFDSNRLDKKIKFKEDQPDHFKKHQLVSNVFFVPETETDKLDNDYIYPEDAGKQKPLVGVYIVANSDEFKDLMISSAASGKDSKDLETLKNDIVKEFYDEFKLVEELLPFRLVLFYVSKLKNGEDSQKLSKRQILIKDQSIEFSEPITVE